MIARGPPAVKVGAGVLLLSDDRRKPSSIVAPMCTRGTQGATSAERAVPCIGEAIRRKKVRMIAIRAAKTLCIQ